MTVDADQELDATGLNCPLPLLRTKKALERMRSGQLLRVVATDPASVRDFDVFAHQTGCSLLESSEADGKFHFLLRKR